MGKAKGRISKLIDISVCFGFWCDKRARHLPNRTPPVQYQSTPGRVNFIITVNRQKWRGWRKKRRHLHASFSLCKRTGKITTRSSLRSFNFLPLIFIFFAIFTTLLLILLHRGRIWPVFNVICCYTPLMAGNFFPTHLPHLPTASASKIRLVDRPLYRKKVSTYFKSQLHWAKTTTRYSIVFRCLSRNTF